MSDAQKQLIISMFRQREHGVSHSPYEKEFEYYECVQKGDLERLAELFCDLAGPGTGVLSSDPLRNVKYHFAITVALVTRYCVDGGMEMETAYNLSDYYIKKGDECSSIAEVNRVNREMAFDFASRMKRDNTRNISLKQAARCMEYIYNNLHSELTLKQIAEHLSLSESYVSRLFREEVGMTVHQYVTEKRIEAAKSLLKYSDYPSYDIANYLCFSSHSHFISVFKAKTGMTPLQYRNRHFHSDWTGAEHKAD